MKRVLRKSVVLLLAFAMVFSLTLPVAAAAKTTIINMKKKPTTKKISMTAGSKVKLTIKADKKKVGLSKVTFKSFKKTVAMVNKKGIITAKKAGKTTILIKAKIKKKKRTVKLKLTVKKKNVPKPAPAPAPDPKPVEPQRESITLPFMSTSPLPLLPLRPTSKQLTREPISGIWSMTVWINLALHKTSIMHILMAIPKKLRM